MRPVVLRRSRLVLAVARRQLVEGAGATGALALLAGSPLLAQAVDRQTPQPVPALTDNYIWTLSDDLGRALGFSPDPGHVNFWTPKTFERFVRAHFDVGTFCTHGIYQIALVPVSSYRAQR